MRKLFSCLSAAAVVTVLASACDRTPDTSARANDKNLAPGSDGRAQAPEGSPAGTSGTGVKPDAPAAAPAFRDVTIPAGTVLTVRLNTAVGSDTSRVEQRVDGTLARDVTIGGVEALGAGATLRGIVTNAERSGRVKGRANVAFKFEHIASNGTVYPISTRTVSREAAGTKKRDAATIGIPAAGGAIIGGIIGGGDGAVKGGAIGGAAGTAAVLSTRGKEVRLAPGTAVTVRLAQPLTVRVPVR